MEILLLLLVPFILAQENTTDNIEILKLGRKRIYIIN